jgi:hypothetical protein
MTAGQVCVPAKAGSIVCFSSLTPHMTGPNTTDGIRKAYICQYARDGAPPPRHLCPLSLSLPPLHHAHVHILCLTRFQPSRTRSSLWLRIGCPFLLPLAVPYVLFALDQRMMGLRMSMSCMT